MLATRIPQHLMNVQRQLQCQAGFRVVEVEAGDFLDAFETVDEGVPVNVEVVGSLFQVAVAFKVHFQRADEFFAVFVFEQGAKNLLLEGFEFGTVFDLQEQTINQQIERFLQEVERSQ